MGTYTGDPGDLRTILGYEKGEGVVCFTCGIQLDPNDPAIYWSGCGGTAEPILWPSGVWEMHPGKDIVLHPNCAVELSVKLIADAQRILPKVRVVA